MPAHDNPTTPKPHDPLRRVVGVNDKVHELPTAERGMIWGVGAGKRPVLVEWQDDNTPGRRWVLATDDVTIGRDAPSDLVIHTEQVSRRHLRIYREGNRYFVADLGSKNGTWVNGGRVGAGTRIRDGDEINVALVVKLIFIGEDAEPTGAS